MVVNPPFSCHDHSTFSPGSKKMLSDKNGSRPKVISNLVFIALGNLRHRSRAAAAAAVKCDTGRGTGAQVLRT